MEFKWSNENRGGMVEVLVERGNEQKIEHYLPVDAVWSVKGLSLVLTKVF